MQSADLIWRHPFDKLPPTEAERNEQEKRLKVAVNRIKKSGKTEVVRK